MVAPSGLWGAIMEVQAKKISVSIPSPLLDDLQYLSARLGVSRSALITELLGDALPVVVGLLKMVPEGASPDEAKRFRGASVDIIRERVAEAQRLADEYEADVAARDAGLPAAGCTCTITKHERQENRTCPVHFPSGGAK